MYVYMNGVGMNHLKRYTTYKHKKRLFWSVEWWTKIRIPASSLFACSFYIHERLRKRTSNRLETLPVPVAFGSSRWFSNDFGHVRPARKNPNGIVKVVGRCFHMRPFCLALFNAYRTFSIKGSLDGPTVTLIVSH